MDKPILSPNFTVNDIHKLREWNYERRKNMTNDELIADIQNGADESQKRIDEIRRKRQKNHAQ